MRNLVIGIVCILFSLFLFFLSPKENKNMLGYKSPQQGLNKNVWKWSNKCFGVLAIVGSSIYLIATIILLLSGNDKYGDMINRIGLVYTIISVIITEIYTLILSLRNR